MGSLIAYSGIVAKIKAMERWRITDGQFQSMAALETVPEAVRFLKQFPPYEAIFAGAEDEALHRGYIEHLLNQSQYRDFAKLYRFAGVKQRRFLDMFFMHYEIDIIKTCLRGAAGHQEQRQDLSAFKEFFEHHSRINLIQLSECGSIEAFISELKGTPYYDALEALEQKGTATLPACETALDMLYFKTMWKIAKGTLKGDEKKTILQCFGTRMDMLNIQWICRSKKYYRLSSGEIYAMIIPIRLHLTRGEINRMAEAENLSQVYDVLKTSWYGRLSPESFAEEPQVEELAAEMNDRIYEMTSRKNPYSIASLNSYLYFKEKEIKRIINTIEKIRYGVAGG